MKIGQRVELVRRQRGALTRTELAAQLDVDRSTVTKWATGKASPRDLEQVAKILGVSVADIYAASAKKRRAA